MTDRVLEALDGPGYVLDPVVGRDDPVSIVPESKLLVVDVPVGQRVGESFGLSRRRGSFAPRTTSNGTSTSSV